MKRLRHLFLLVLLLLSATSVWAYDFELNGIYYNIIGDNAVEVTYKDYTYNSYSGQVTIPDRFVYQGTYYYVSAIGMYAFRDCTELYKVVIPSTVTSISYGAFYYCSALTTINIPNSVTSIGTMAFNRCSNMVQAVIGNAVESIGARAFYACTALSSIYIPGSTCYIGDRAFATCTALTGFVVAPSNAFFKSESGVLYDYDMDTLVQYPCGKEGSFTIPNTVSFIKPYAFLNAAQLSSVHLNDLVQVDGNTFSGCGMEMITVNPSNEKYKTVDGVLYDYYIDTLVFYPQKRGGRCVIPNTVSTLGFRSFFTSSVADVAFPNSIKVIGYEAFGYCDSLKEVNLPSTIKHIELGAFANCTSLESINVDSRNRRYSSVEGVLFNHNQDTIIQYPAGKTGKTYVVPSSVRALIDGYDRNLSSNAYGGFAPSGVFASSKLQSVVVPNTVHYVGHYTFYSCPKLSMVTLGNAVDSVGIYVFSQDSVLRSVVCLGANPPKYDDGNTLIWNSNNDGITLTVPCGAKDLYIEKWGRYFDEDQIEEACEEHAVQTFSNDPEMGTVNTSATSAMCGDIIDIVVNSSFAYGAYGIEVCDAYDETMLIPVSNNQFVMPDFDVTVKVFFSHTSVGENEDTEAFICPNPTTDRVLITCEDMRSVVLYTTEGKVIKVLDGLNADEVEMELIGLSKGLYMIHIETLNGRKFDGKLIIQ